MIIDAHVHTFARNPAAAAGGGCVPAGEIVWRAVAAGIERIAVSSLGRTGYLRHPSEEEVGEANDDVHGLMRDYPGKVYGFCYLNPLNGNWKDELEKRADSGFAGIKLWVAAKCSSPEVFSVAEEAARRNLPLLVHSFLKTPGNLENESTPFDVAGLALKYPEAKILMAHAAGNRREGVEAVRKMANVYVDTSGSNPRRGVVEDAVSLLGARRVVFGSDAPGRSYAVQMAKVSAAGISEEQKQMIFSANFLRLVGSEDN